jgi:hypothetical protein
VKIWFRFVPREDWLPYDTEGLWAVPVSADTARVANVPFLQDGVAQGDIVRFTTDDNGVRWAVGGSSRRATARSVSCRSLTARWDQVPRPFTSSSRGSALAVRRLAGSCRW